MKKQFFLVFLISLLFVAAPITAEAQPQLATTALTFSAGVEKGSVLAKLVFGNPDSVTNVLDTTYSTTGTPTNYVKMPQDYGRAIAYAFIDSAGTTDTLNITVQGSHNGTKWYTITTFTQIVSAGGNQQYARKEIAYADRYIRLLNILSGSYPKRLRMSEYILAIQ